MSTALALPPATSQSDTSDFIPALHLANDALIGVLESSVYPGAKRESIALVIDYCRAARLDPLQQPVHILPIQVESDKLDSKGFPIMVRRDVIRPGIGLYRTQASRTEQHDSTSQPEFGPEREITFRDRVTEWENGQKTTRWVEATLVYPEWCRVTVKRRRPDGHVSVFVGFEYWLENYATKGDGVTPNAMWRKRPRAQLAKCFDTATEVLTTRGFEPFASATGQILQVTDQGLAPCDARPFSQPYDAEMVVAEGTRLNFSVTPNHDMVTTAGKIEASALYAQATSVSKFEIPRAPHCPRPDRPDISDAQLTLAGYFLADGSHTGYHQLRIAVSRPYKVDALRALGLHEAESLKAEAGNTALLGNRVIRTASDKAVFTYPYSLIEPLAAPDKVMAPETILSLSSRQARVLVDALLDFDGNHDPSTRTRRFFQKNENVLRAFELACLHAGLSIGPRVARTDADSGVTISVSEAQHFPVVRGVPKNTASLVKRRNVAGLVWCVTVPSGVIVVRRNGFSMLCGNCAEAQALRRGFPGIANAPTADETEGHPLLIERDEDEPQGTPEPAKLGAPQRRSSKAAQAASEATPPPPPAPPPPPPPPPPPAPPAATSEPAADRDPFGEDPAPPAAAPASEPAAAPPAHDPGPGDQRPEPPPQTPREPAQASPNGNKPASAAWLRTLRVRIQAANWTEAAILKQFDLEQLDGISTARATEIAGWVQANARNPG